MPLVTSKEMLLDAQKGNYAVGAFNVENMEMVMAVVEAAQEMQSPVILQTTPSTVKYAGLNLYYANVKAAAERASVPVALHLDHGDSFELAVQALREGYTSIMIDGSHLPLGGNTKLVRRVVEACHPCKVPVEAELGCVGGKEDDLVNHCAGLTEPEQAVEFVQQTGIDFLAVAIGTAHGVYKGTPRIRLDLLSEIKKRVFIPLVLHGTSGVEDDVVRSCIQEGICKVNYATDLRIAFSDGVKRILNEDKSVIDPKIYGKMGKELVKRYVQDKIWVCKSSGRGF
ncbi:fructose-bisphosphate aldolase [Lacrimispora amygdalina]|uniref:Fructose-bisphosphate aldolase n=1 Tax=Lacrimispora amygdalina TaxID=253257 RepID=A0A3E2N8F7_9FIRM|nr:ketose-bisphosphate aldolase [Clostridium indicum]RFZ77276.1 ketose-bisphosphate aldolase [Clostridium indicum]